LRGIQQSLKDFEQRGVRVLAISVDTPEESRNLCQKRGYTYAFLSDANRDVIRRYDIVHKDGGPTGDIARPAEFLIDPSGTVRWVNLTDDYRIRARPQEILAAIDRAKD
jgi:peroxiredoxin